MGRASVEKVSSQMVNEVEEVYSHKHYAQISIASVLLRNLKSRVKSGNVWYHSVLNLVYSRLLSKV